MNGLETSDLVDQLLPALIAAQAAFRPATKGSENPHFRSRYADLSDVWEACAGPLQANGFAVTYPLQTGEAGGITLSVVLWHTSGQWMRSTLPILGDLRKPQEVGSCITYYRRYLLAALLAIPTVDDDGEAAAGRGPGQRDARPRREDRGAPRTSPPVPANGDGASHDRRPVDSRPANGAAPPRSKDDWHTFIKDRLDRADKNWHTEMTLAGIAREVQAREEFQMPNLFKTTNHFVSHAIEAGAIKAADVAKDGTDKRDPAKAKAALATIYAKAPRKVRAAVEEYLSEKERGLRVALGMDDLDATDEVGEMAAGREPGSDDDR